MVKKSGNAVVPAEEEMFPSPLHLFNYTMTSQLYAKICAKRTVSMPTFTPYRHARKMMIHEATRSWLFFVLLRALRGSFKFWNKLRTGCWQPNPLQTPRLFDRQRQISHTGLGTSGCVRHLRAASQGYIVNIENADS